MELTLGGTTYDVFANHASYAFEHGGDQIKIGLPFQFETPITRNGESIGRLEFCADTLRYIARSDRYSIAAIADVADFNRLTACAATVVMLDILARHKC